jgi:heptosyltransferase-3
MVVMRTRYRSIQRKSGVQARVNLWAPNRFMSFKFSHSPHSRALMRRRIGILRTGSMGDHLIALPLYRQIKEAHPGDTLILVCNLPARGNPKLVGPASFLPESLFAEWHNYPVGSDWTAIKDTYRLIRNADLDLLYYLMPARTPKQLWRDKIFFWLARVPVIGLRKDAAARGTQRLADSNPIEHETDRLARSIALQAHKTPRDLSIDLTGAEHAEARVLLGGAPACALVISIGTKLTVNDWGVDKWSQLVSSLGSVQRIDRLVLIGAADEYAYSETLRQHWPRQAMNFCGRLSPRQSAAVLAQARLFVGHDSGPMHMAAAVDVPIVAVFSSRNPPGLWFPLSANKRIHYSVIECMGCGKLTCEELQKECIRRIGVNEVFDSCVAALDGEQPSATILQFSRGNAGQGRAGRA